jgi:hypothetical protein
MPSDKVKNDITFYVFMSTMAIGFIVGVGYLIYSWFV